MRPLKVLIGCERSGVIRRAMAAAGHEAYSVDLAEAEDNPIPGSGSGTHLVGDVFQTLRAWPHLFDPLRIWDLFICHPECTYLSSSGLHWNKRVEGRELKTKQAVEFAVALWRCGAENSRRMAMENPRGRLGPVMRELFGIEASFIQPYQFGDDASKGTCLWLHNLAPLRPTKFITPRMVCECGHVTPKHEVEAGAQFCAGCDVPINSKKCKPRWANQTDGGQNKLPPSETRWMERSRTYDGPAAAIVSQWGSLQ